MSNIKLLQTLLASSNNSPTLIDTAAAVRVAYSDDGKVSADERDFILRNFTGKLAPVINLTEQADPIAYSRYVEGIANTRGQKANHVNAFLRKLMTEYNNDGDAEKILEVLKYNKEFLPQAITLSGDVKLFRTPELQRKVDERLLKLRDEGKGYTYPYTPRVGTFNVYHGTPILTPYSWFGTNLETKAWMETEASFTERILNGIPFMKDLLTHLKDRADYPRITPPIIIGDYYYYDTHKPGENKFVYVRRPLLGGPEEVIINPNNFQEKEILKTVEHAPNKQVAVVGISTGSDWQEFYLMDMSTGKINRDTEIDHIKWTPVLPPNSINNPMVWDKDSKGFYYARYDEPAKGQELIAKTTNRRICYHKLSTTQDEDQVVYFDSTKPDSRPNFTITPDGRFSFVTISEDNKGLDGNALLFRDNTKVASPTSPFTPIISQAGDLKYKPVGNVGGKLLVLTNDGAPNNRLVLIDPTDHPEDKTKWKDVLPEQQDSPLQSIEFVEGKLFATRMQNASSRIVVYDLKGKVIKELSSPKIGAVKFQAPLPGVSTAFYTTQSFNQPPIIYKIDLKTLRTEIFKITEVPNFSADNYELKQVHFHIVRKGKEIPASMFIMHRKGLELNGENPLLASGYGGFNSPKPPFFSAMEAALIDQKVVRVWVNLPGDGGHGEEWHRRGMKENKPHVFDAFIASLELLIKDGYTNSNRLAIEGGSNGGLLVAAVMNQRPDLARVVIANVPFVDIVRFKKYSSGREWTAELGDPESDPDAFNGIVGYSPVHNVRPREYPAVMVITGQQDARVPPPLNAFPWLAQLQRNTTSGSDSPVVGVFYGLAGHNPPTFSNTFQQAATTWGFMLHYLGVTPNFKTTGK